MVRIHQAIAAIILIVGLAGEGWAADPLAARVRTDTSNFDNNLGAGDTNVQKALETMDEMVGGGASYNQSLNTTDNIQFNNITTGNTTITGVLLHNGNKVLNSTSSGLVDHNTTGNFSVNYHFLKSQVDHNTTENYTANRHFLEADINISNTKAVTSAEFAARISDETGTGLLVYNKTATFEDVAVVGSFTHNGNVVQNTTSAFNITKATAFPSSELAGRISDEKGTGYLVFNESTTLASPTFIGTPVYPANLITAADIDENTLLLKNQTKCIVITSFNSSFQFPIWKAAKTTTLINVSACMKGLSVGNFTLEDWNATAESLINTSQVFDVPAGKEVSLTAFTDPSTLAGNYMYVNGTGPTTAGNSTLTITIRFSE